MELLTQEAQSVSDQPPWELISAFKCLSSLTPYGSTPEENEALRSDPPAPSELEELARMAKCAPYWRQSFALVVYSSSTLGF